MCPVKNLEKLGYQVINHIYTDDEINQILNYISKKKWKKTFGIRYFLHENKALNDWIFTSNFKNILQKITPNPFIIKSIYFDKPPNANWIVDWHQDLTINVNGKTDDPNYKKWRSTKKRSAVQPPLKILQEIFTVRIHLDDCKTENGALRVIPKSHLNGIGERHAITEEMLQSEKICEVRKGGILLIKPMILHSSKRSENQLNRRVIHIEFSSNPLAQGVTWLEKQEIFIHHEN